MTVLVFVDQQDDSDPTKQFHAHDWIAHLVRPSAGGAVDMDDVALHRTVRMEVETERLRQIAS